MRALSKKPPNAQPIAREIFFPNIFKMWSKTWLHTKIQPSSYLESFPGHTRLSQRTWRTWRTQRTLRTGRTGSIYRLPRSIPGVPSSVTALFWAIAPLYTKLFPLCSRSWENWAVTNKHILDGRPVDRKKGNYKHGLQQSCFVINLIVFHVFAKTDLWNGFVSLI